jgi:hypothetical protein
VLTQFAKIVLAMALARSIGLILVLLPRLKN